MSPLCFVNNRGSAKSDLGNVLPLEPWMTRVTTNHLQMKTPYLGTCKETVRPTLLSRLPLESTGGWT